ncbi:MAG: hypothetical protein PHS36_07260 [Candidatus Cloacimonetes bacterium]|nr:hypothetical protein [Candidatus Cloacimonadota bacterium]
MKFNKHVFCLIIMTLLAVTYVFANKAVPSTGTKKLDLDYYHNVGNIWLRVSNYGFFGSGDDAVPQYPSLEYPGGSGVDYLYQGALWFGAKKQRRDISGRKLYWLQYPPQSKDDYTYEGSDLWNSSMTPLLDTLVTVGFDGDADLYEFLPAYNPLIATHTTYELYNRYDAIATASTRTQKRGVDDDGDGLIDEDFPGYTFPFRADNELPEAFQTFGSMYPSELSSMDLALLSEPENYEIWFPLGFMDLYDPDLQHGARTYTYSKPYDDDFDGRMDEDGAPVSEQDFIGYYYDYCPLGITTVDRDYGGSKGQNTHYPLNIKVRQMSYQWSYDYIKNLVYIEFNITNMNVADTLYDCAMGIYMDSDIGPNTYGSEKAADDKSGYVKGEGYEFAYTYDADFDHGLSPGLVGARVCSPDPDALEFHCWYWKVGNGPDDSDPRDVGPTIKTSNQKYWLLTGTNPDDSKYTPLRPEDSNIMEWEQPSPNDTRFLFAFYGAQPDNPGDYNATDEYGNYYKRWNLAPEKTMKIVVAVFPGDTKEELKSQASWAKIIYGKAQDLVTVILPDTFPHYNPPEPPEIPNMHAEIVQSDTGTSIDVYWDNRSEFSYDFMNVPTAEIGWQNPHSTDYTPVTDLDSWPTPDQIAGNWPDYWPEEFRFPSSSTEVYPYKNNAVVNPFTGFRLRHDFQGYTMWGRSGSGSSEDWQQIRRWDKVDTDLDRLDYEVAMHTVYDSLRKDYGGYTGIDMDLPNPSNSSIMSERGWQASTEEYQKFYKLDQYYSFEPNGAIFHGWPLYDPDKDWTPEIQAQADQIAEDNAMLSDTDISKLQARLFMHPYLKDEINRPDLFDVLYDTRMIPLKGFAFPGVDADPEAEQIELLKKQRLARRFYKATINHPPRGVEYYVALTAYDRGIPEQKLSYLETGRDADANMKILFPGTLARDDMKDIMVIPNPYIGRSKFDGRRENDEKGDKSRRLWFTNLPRRCTIRIYTLAGDLVDTIHHDGASVTDIVTISKAATQGIAADGMESWDLLSKNNQIIAPGVYLFSVENKDSDKVKVGKFVVIK